MERAWPIAGLCLAAVLELSFSPQPGVVRFEPARLAEQPAVSTFSWRRELSPQQMFLADIKLDINQASVTELRALPDIGNSLAQAIVGARPLRCEADLLRIAGFGIGRLARVLPFLKALPKRCASPEADEGVKYLP